MQRSVALYKWLEICGLFHSLLITNFKYLVSDHIQMWTVKANCKLGCDLSLAPSSSFTHTWDRQRLRDQEFNTSSHIWIVMRWQWHLQELLLVAVFSTLFSVGNFTFEENFFINSKCFFKSVARIASTIRKRSLFHSAESRFLRKLNEGFEWSNSHDADAWWFSKTERSLYSIACK